MYALVAALLLYAILHKAPTFLIAITPLVLNTAILIFASPSPDFRYMYPVYLAGIIVAPALVWLSASRATVRSSFEQT
jgi:hypothetical protein